MSTRSAMRVSEIDRPVLDLSAEALRAGLKAMIAGAEEHGGIERYADAVRMKSSLFREALVEAPIGDLAIETFMGLCTFMATVRRRIGPLLNQDAFAGLRSAIVELFDDSVSVDERIDRFCGRYPDDGQHRWVRDLAAELLHNADPERYPLMNRWVWDSRANTGVLREIWHADDVDRVTIRVADGYGTCLMLREELSQFLTENGFFRDILWYVDVLCAQIYAHYICEQGGSYLRADFASPEDPMQHTRRLLGLDGVRAGNGRTRLKSVDGEAFVIDEHNLLERAGN